MQAHFYWPATEKHEASLDSSSGAAQNAEPWILVNSTPASCSQLGLNHCFKDKQAIDIVVSGPNYGRNTTAVFALSSGTMGAALEAAVSGYKAIALSFAFFDRINDPKITEQSCRQSVKVVEWLAKNGDWDAGRIFTVNVPVQDGVGSKPTMFTKILQNEWTSGSCFEETNSAVEDPATEEQQLRRQESREGQGAQAGSEGDKGAGDRWKGRHFKWAPSFKDVFESVRKSGPGNDGWAVSQGQTSITALRANFMHIDGYQGEVKL